jgi:F0F1-type ATP synthase delta subunit
MMNADIKKLESQISQTLVSNLGSSYELSDKARKRIEKSAGKLAGKLVKLFEKEEKDLQGRSEESTASKMEDTDDEDDES